MEKKLLDKKKILFIGPVFFGYYLNIIEVIEHAGGEVEFISDYSHTIWAKLFKNINKKIYDWYNNRYLQIVLSKIHQKEFDIIFIIKGTIISVEFLSRIKERNINARFITYQWDSIKNFDYQHVIPFFTDIFSFDIEDCKNIHKLKYLPLPFFFHEDYIKLASVKENHQTDIDILFVGTFYIERYYQLVELSRLFRRSGIRFYCYHYIPFLSYLKALSKGKIYGNIRFRKISHNKILNLYQRSKIILDLPHVGQSGYTNRVLDAIGAGKKLITTNDNIKNEWFYSENNIYIIKKFKDMELNNFISIPFDRNGIQQHIHNHSIEKWVKSIFYYYDQ